MRPVTFRDVVVAVIFLACVVFAASSFAHGEKSTPPPATPTQIAAPDNDRKLANAVGAGLTAGFAATALRNEPYGYAYAFGGTVAAAAIIEAAHQGPYQSRNVWYAVGGAAVGSVGTCLIYFRKDYVGCAFTLGPKVPQK